MHKYLEELANVKAQKIAAMSITAADLVLVADTVEGCARDNARTFESVKIGSDGLDFLEAFVASVESIQESLLGKECRDYGLPRPLTETEARQVTGLVFARYDLTCLGRGAPTQNTTPASESKGEP